MSAQSSVGRIVTVTAYDEAGEVAGQVRDVTYRWAGPRRKS